MPLGWILEAVLVLILILCMTMSDANPYTKTCQVKHFVPNVHFLWEKIDDESKNVISNIY